MIELNKYFKRFEANDELFEILRKERFLKTELDVVYDDFVRWEKNGLLLNKKENKHQHRKYNYIDYSWVKLVEQLRQFGFDYDSIKTFKDSLSAVFDNEFYKLAIEERREELLNYYPKEEINQFYKELDNIEDDNEITFFESLIVNVANYNDTVSILFFKDTVEFFPVSSEILKEFEKRSEDSKYFQYFKRSHVSISINEITKRFIINNIPTESRSNKFTSILSEKEHNILKIVRKDYKGLKSITIKTKDRKLHRIEVATTKKINAESTLLKHFKVGDYQTLETETVDGKIVYYKQTDKYKL